MKLRALAPAKVNLTLFLGPTRSDGRHELVTVLESLSLADTLTLTTRSEGLADQVTCPGVTGTNLAETALAGLRARGWGGPPLKLEITKRIPVAGGMAGGSSDAAAAIRLALQVAPAPAADFEAVAASLGSDVPSQLIPGLSFGTSAGEVIDRLAPIGAHAFVVIPSAHELPTAAVYAEADRMRLVRTADELASLNVALTRGLAPDLELPAELIVNDLQPAAVSLCPSIGLALGAALAAGADQAIVSGSGPTVVGIWWGKDATRRAADAARTLTSAHPGTVAAVPVGPEFGAAEAF